MGRAPLKVSFSLRKTRLSSLYLLSFMTLPLRVWGWTSAIIAAQVPPPGPWGPTQPRDPPSDGGCQYLPHMMGVNMAMPLYCSLEMVLFKMSPPKLGREQTAVK